MLSDDDSDTCAELLDWQAYATSVITSFIEAIELGKVDDAGEMLSERPWLIDTPGSYRMFTPLQAAIIASMNNSVKWLLENGADVHCQGAKERGPIHLASQLGNRTAVNLLLAHGASVHGRDRRHNMTPIYLASRYGHARLVKFLLRHGAETRDKDFPAYHPLHIACKRGHYEVAEILLDHGASVSDLDEAGNTPLYYACQGRYIICDDEANSCSVVELLLKNGADVNHPDRQGHHILDWEILAAPIEGEPDVDIDWCGVLRPLLQSLLDYGAGAGITCRLEETERHPKCNTTVLMCFFSSLRRESCKEAPTGGTWSYEEVRDSFEEYFIKISAAELSSNPEEKAFHPPVKDLDWKLLRRSAYLSKCEEELGRMKVHGISNTTGSATYFDVLSRNKRTLLKQKLGEMTLAGCQILYPIYGKMLHCSYLQLRRPILLVRSAGFFSILSPPMLPECAEAVMSFLSNKDLEIVAAVKENYLEKLEQSSTEKPSVNSDPSAAS